jgi:hypothetical protein
MDSHVNNTIHRDARPRLHENNFAWCDLRCLHFLPAILSADRGRRGQKTDQMADRSAPAPYGHAFENIGDQNEKGDD